MWQDDEHSPRGLFWYVFCGVLGVILALLVAALLLAGIIALGAWSCQDLKFLGCGT